LFAEGQHDVQISEWHHFRGSHEVVRRFCIHKMPLDGEYLTIQFACNGFLTVNASGMCRFHRIQGASIADCSTHQGLPVMEQSDCAVVVTHEQERTNVIRLATACPDAIRSYSSFVVFLQHVWFFDATSKQRCRIDVMEKSSNSSKRKSSVCRAKQSFNHISVHVFHM